jgi:hypothetical protein
MSGARFDRHELAAGQLIETGGEIRRGSADLLGQVRARDAAVACDAGEQAGGGRA